jgi:hypothetical protein
MNTPQRIQRVEFCGYSGPVHCPFCGQAVLPAEDDAPEVRP